MPKKTASARGNAQRNRTKMQKGVQLVRPVSPAPKGRGEREKLEEAEGAVTSATIVAEEEEEMTRATGAGRVAAPSPTPASSKGARTSSEAVVSTTAAPRSASARMAARRQQQQAAQKAHQRQSASLITAEHYAYVRRDLLFIAILAIIMFSALIVLHFVPAIGG
jgi:hypothetical protein